MTSDPDMFHLWTLLKEAHSDSLDNICSHPLTAEQIEDLAEGKSTEYFKGIELYSKLLSRFKKV